jgi:hypothetical protein
VVTLSKQPAKNTGGKGGKNMGIPIGVIIQGLGLLGSQIQKTDKEIDPAGVNKKEADDGKSLTDGAMDILELYKKVKEGGTDVLSDEECKFIRQFREEHEPGEIASIIIRHGETLDPSDMRSLVSMVPKEYLAGLPDIDFDGEFGNTEEEAEILKRCAEGVHNYFYNYKPQSGENPNVPHTGSMAQEIERVDPALIKIGPKGKMVDAPRLTLTNSGAIGTLARKTEALEQKIDTLAQQLDALLQRSA